MAGTLTPTPYQTVLDSDGVAVSGAKVYTYEAGTTTNATTYTTSALNVANANPIVADSAGRYVAYLAAGQNLRFIIKTSADVTIDTRTISSLFRGPRSTWTSRGLWAKPLLPDRWSTSPLRPSPRL